MKLIFLGSGSAFAPLGNYQSNMILQAKSGKNLLLDCGSDIRMSLHEQGFSHYDIHDVYISHLHADHVGGLEWLAFSTKFDPKCQKPIIHAAEDVLKDLWDKSLSGGLSSLQGVNADIYTYFDTDPVPANSYFTWHHIQFNIIQTVHAICGYAIMPAYGLLFTINNTTIFITMDSQLVPLYLDSIYVTADIIFHDCETSPCKSGVHAHYSELCQLPQEIKQKMWLYHYNGEFLPDCIKDGFAGFVTKGQSFDFS
jgi:ribonuclease BN (tRNA processing enzyme)